MTISMVTGYWLALLVLGDGVADNRPENVRPIPPPGISVSEVDRQSLMDGIGQLRKGLATASRAFPTDRHDLAHMLIDVELYAEAVERTLETGMVYRPNDVAVLKETLQNGLTRLAQLQAGDAKWTKARGPIARGYRSRIDGSIQPYGIIVPESWRPDSMHRHRLDIWFHGRGEKLSEVDFINQRSRSLGEFAPADAFVLHPYGRYNNANRFAGEVDTFEALANVCSQYRIDPDRISVRGFSMGGAACWQFATHHASKWVAAAPGAGFSETPDFLKVFQHETLAPNWWEKKLWHLYDATDYALNLKMCPTVAYSGEIDKQRQAAEIMIATARDRCGINLVHIIGPQTGHKYEPQAKKEIARLIDTIVEHGRDTVPRSVQFTTYSLRYADAGWIHLDALMKHWEEATVKAVRRDGEVEISTRNIAGLSIHFEPGKCPFEIGSTPMLRIDGVPVKPPSVPSDRGWDVHCWRTSKSPLWRLTNPKDTSEFRKRPCLQGPIDDAFMDSFAFVLPTGKPMHRATGTWVKAESERAVRQWLLQFRGKVPSFDDVKLLGDPKLLDALVRDSNLVVWGDPKSNGLLKKVVEKLPLEWTADHVSIAGASYPSSGHMPILIYPNPLNPKRYVVLNSGFTFREYDQLNNARQTPKLPDFAVIDVSTPPNSRWPGKVAAAGFFTEHWNLSTKSSSGTN